MERIFTPCGPATVEHHGAIGGFRHAPIGERDQGPRLDPGGHRLAPEALSVPPHEDVAPRADHVRPMSVLQGLLQRGAIELAVTQ